MVARLSLSCYLRLVHCWRYEALVNQGKIDHSSIGYSGNGASGEDI